MQHLSSRHMSISAISQLLLTRFWWNFKGRFLGTSRTDSNCQGDICPCNICPRDICPYQEYLSCYWPDFDETLKVGSWEHLEQIPTVTVTFSRQHLFWWHLYISGISQLLLTRFGLNLKGKVKARLKGMINNSNSFNEYQINFYRPRLTPYEQLQQ